MKIELSFVLSIIISLAALWVSFNTDKSQKNALKVSNAQWLINYFEKKITEGHGKYTGIEPNPLRINFEKASIKDIFSIFYRSCIRKGYFYGVFYKENSREYLTILDLFQEGAPDAGAISDILDLLEFVAKNVSEGKADKNLILFELGVYFFTLKSWLSKTYPENFSPPKDATARDIADAMTINDQSFLKKHYPNIYQITKKSDLSCASHINWLGYE